METVRPTIRRDLRYVAAAALAALIAVEVEAASRATFDAVQTSTAIAYRVVTSPGHVRAAAGVSLSLTTMAICVILLARVATRRAGLAPDPAILAMATHFDSRIDWQNRRIRAARLGGALDR